jgi:hypothetical protein
MVTVFTGIGEGLLMRKMLQRILILMGSLAILTCIMTPQIVFAKSSMNDYRREFIASPYTYSCKVIASYLNDNIYWWENLKNRHIHMGIGIAIFLAVILFFAVEKALFILEISTIRN